MSESLYIAKNLTKEQKYEELAVKLDALCNGETDRIARMANIAAALREVFGFFWVGFYRVVENQLVLGPFQGSIACQRIPYGRGVCGTAWKEGRTLLVRDVNEFPGHIACSSNSKSEIVIPVFDQSKNIIAVLDVDSDRINDFDPIDQMGLEKIAQMAT